ncbi:hypothetical protein BSKO_03761 [Bryopsis sp. KO-2023]|nr:hypothetical protein BSKO_03761 [Bryopsis sp. KO-2023]
MAASPLRYSIMSSPCPRFKENITCAPFGAYDIDTFTKKSMETHFKAFRSRSGRFRKKMPTSEAPDVMYTCNRLKNNGYSETGLQAEHSPIKYSIHRSKYPRLIKAKKTDAPDIEYNTDWGKKQFLTTKIKKSPQLYSNIDSKGDRWMRPKTTACGDNLGPGCYDTPHYRDIRTTHLNKRPMSTFVSTSSRFYNDRLDPTKNLGSTWRPEFDTMHWVKRGVTISPTKYLRPQYLPSCYMEADPTKR